MIDRVARIQLVEQLRHFVAGLNNNFTYDDLSRHKLMAKWALAAHNKAIFLRYILFLKTNQANHWPEKHSVILVKLLFSSLNLGLLASHHNCHWATWPFLTTDDFEVAKLNPVYLANV